MYSQYPSNYTDTNLTGGQTPGIVNTIDLTPHTSHY